MIFPSSSMVHPHYFGLARSQAGSRWIRASSLKVTKKVFLDSDSRANLKLGSNQLSQIDRRNNFEDYLSSQLEDRSEPALLEK